MSHIQGVLTSMTARISKPAKNAMQSGAAKTREWQLDYEPEQPRAIEPLMGWTSSGDMKQQLSLRFDTKEEAVAYCEREGIPIRFSNRRSRRAGKPPMPTISHSGAASPGPIEGKAYPAFPMGKSSGLPKAVAQ